MLRLFRQKPKVSFKTTCTKLGQEKQQDNQESKRQSTVGLRLLLRQAFDEDEYGIIIALLGAGVNLTDAIDETGKASI